MMMTTMEMTVFTSVPWRLLLPFRRAPRSHCLLIPAGSFRSFLTLLRVCSVGREHLPRRSACLSPRQSRGVAGAATPLLSSCPSVVRLPACHTAGRRGVLRSAEGAGGEEAARSGLLGGKAAAFRTPSAPGSAVLDGFSAAANPQLRVAPDPRLRGTG